MRLIPALVIFVSCLCSVTAQQPAEWERVYTFDDSTIDMSTALLSFMSEDVTRLRFRWIFDQPQSLSAEVEYKSRLEVMEFNCTRHEARPYHITFLDAAGATVRIQDLPGKWRKVTPGSMTERLFEPACKLVNQKLNPPVIDRDKLELQKAARYAFSIAQELESSKDFGTIISKFFAMNYLSGYLQDDEHKWFHNLVQSTATNVNRNELQRFYIALMNTGYLSSLYVMSRLPSGSDTDPAFDKLFPPDVLRLIRNHAHRANYKTGEGPYGFLEAKINTRQQLRSYTNLLEGIASSLRKHVSRIDAQRSRQYREVMQNWDLYSPRVRICARTCLGLPRGTKLFQVNVPVFTLQLAEIEGRLKVVSARSTFD